MFAAQKNLRRNLFCNRAMPLIGALLALGFSACLSPGFNLASSLPEGGGSGLPSFDSSADEGEGSQSGISTGLLTAGDWDDNLNFARYQDFVRDAQQSLGSEAPLLVINPRSLPAREEPAAALDIAFVLDTTGSMYDELDFIEAEIDGIVSELFARFPGLSLRLALVTYRDEGDDYVTHSYDFVDDVSAFRQSVAGENSDGGGDYPEAMDQALAAANHLTWTQVADAAKLVFVIADAPAHSEKYVALLHQVELARERGLVIYPVAASGADLSLELTMRYMAQDTAGRYVFLTDDSGIGDSHLEPSIPCYQVQKLNKLMVRLAAGLVKGAYIAPSDDEILRAVGNPQDGVCEFADGSTAQLY